MIPKRLAAMTIAACLFVVTAGLLVRPSPPMARDTRPRVLALTSTPQPSATERQQRVDRELGRVEQEARQLVTSRLRPVVNLLNQAHRGVPRFAEDALGPRAALAYLTDQVPYAGGGRLHRHVTRAFRTHVLDSARLECVCRDAVMGLAADLDNLDAELLVRLRLDLADLPPATPEPLKGNRPTSAMIATGLTAHATTGLKSWIATELAAVVTSEILVRVTLRAVSAGGLGVLAASGPLTLGTSLAVGLAADHLATWAIDRTLNPRGKLIRATEAQLARLHREVLLGTPRAPGLRPRLERMARAHRESRRVLLGQVLESQNSGAKP